MSRIGRTPISIPDGVTIDLAERVVKVKGPKGSLEAVLPAAIKLEVADGEARLIFFLCGGCLPLDASKFLVRLAADLHVGAVECAHAGRDPRPAYRARGTPSRPSGDALGMEGMLTAKSDDN